MQRVHTFIRLVRPSWTVLTCCKLGEKRRLVTLWAWLTLFPFIGFLPHISQTLAIVRASSFLLWTLTDQKSDRSNRSGSVTVQLETNTIKRAVRQVIFFGVAPKGTSRVTENMSCRGIYLYKGMTIGGDVLEPAPKPGPESHQDAQQNDNGKRLGDQSKPMAEIFNQVFVPSFPFFHVTIPVATV